MNITKDNHHFTTAFSCLKLSGMVAHRVLALVSGGKDSCFSMLECVAAGHTVVALANLKPHDESENELDSYMYQVHLLEYVYAFSHKSRFALHTDCWTPSYPLVRRGHGFASPQRNHQARQVH